MEEKIDSSKILGEPFFDGFNDNVSRIRRNLLAFSVLVLVITLNDLTIAENAPLFGFPLKGLSKNGLYGCLFLITAYHLIHFWVYYRQYLKQWRIRLTAKRLYFQTTSSAKWGEEDAREDTTKPENATLYSWWINHKSKFLEVAEKSQKFLAEEKMEGDALKRLDSLSQNILNLNESFKKGCIEERLRRFDDEFWTLQRRQNVNWLIFEAWLPIALGVVALLSIVCHFIIVTKSPFLPCALSIGINL